jgi:hypothetical protein
MATGMELLNELEADVGYATGETPFPRKVEVAEAIDLVEGLSSVMDRFTAQRAEAAAAAGTPIACGPGCDRCCSEMIMVFRPEVERVVAWLRRPENAGARDQFLAAYPRWRARVGDTPDRLSKMSATGGVAGALFQLYVAHYRKDIKCAFDHEGACTIYPARPLNCRFAHATGDPRNCDPATGVEATRFDFVPLDRLYERTHPVLITAHAAMASPAAAQRHGTRSPAPACARTISAAPSTTRKVKAASLAATPA